VCNLKKREKIARLAGTISKGGINQTYRPKNENPAREGHKIKRKWMHVIREESEGCKTEAGEKGKETSAFSLSPGKVGGQNKRIRKVQKAEKRDKEKPEPFLEKAKGV